MPPGCPNRVPKSGRLATASLAPGLTLAGLRAGCRVVRVRGGGQGGSQGGGTQVGRRWVPRVVGG